MVCLYLASRENTAARSKGQSVPRVGMIGVIRFELIIRDCVVVVYMHEWMRSDTVLICPRLDGCPGCQVATKQMGLGWERNNEDCQHIVQFYVSSTQFDEDRDVHHLLR